MYSDCYLYKKDMQNAEDDVPFIHSRSKRSKKTFMKSTDNIKDGYKRKRNTCLQLTNRFKALDNEFNESTVVEAYTNFPETCAEVKTYHSIQTLLIFV